MYSLSNVARHQLPSSAAQGGGGVYVLDLQRTGGGLVAALASDRSLSLLDPARLGQGPPAAAWRADHGGATTTLRPFGAGEGAALVCTAGEDGTVGVWDVRLRGDAARVAHFRASDAPILSMACSASTPTIAVGTELQNHTASIFLWDVRAAPTARAHYDQAHSDDVTALAWHPSDPALLLSGSTDGLVSLHDTRIADEDELTLQTHNHDASIHHAGFLSDSLAFALSHDERFAIYDVARDGDDAAPTNLPSGDLRAVLGCQYVADVTPKTDGSGAIIGAGSHDRQSFELVFLAKDPAGQSWVLDKSNSVGLPGAHGDEIVRSFCFFDQEQLVLTAGEDGAVKAWRPTG
ncbi:WD domain-containing protein [Hirsutella rhossiliensis]|uniref:WD domain-containing protein n=1 Tax=Hirsutella rhossiliensis TaxID=111463 RepID=A0A9P8NA90_9HYPO|nr:WD domain-containing protein [Hirsutella rhossiliensis]KAH0968579.1 WD domain-containing protein [Hirsutella rhossiliensis]